jgi:hypothetical protein
MAGLFRWFAACLLLAAAWAVATAPGVACPFCSMQGQTLTGEVGQATMVLYGDLVNKKVEGKENAEGEEGTTTLHVETAVKGHKDYADQKEIVLARYIPLLDGKYRYLVFCDVFKGKVDPYRVLPVAKDGDMPRYLKGALEHKDEKPGKRLRFFFDFLDNPDVEISNDAYKEFANADYKDYRDMAKDLPADRVAKWLEPDSNTPAFRYGLYASMLGHCGTEKHADILRKMLDEPARRVGSGVDGILAGYTMLKPKEGWAYTHDILKDGGKEFLLRYAALRAVRFLWESRPDLVPRKELAEGVAQMLDQKDIADLAIDDLRKWGCWDMADRVLGLVDKPVYKELPIIRRAVLRYALCCKGNAAAERYVAEQRKKDEQAVNDAEELLKLEQPAPAGTAGK